MAYVPDFEHDVFVSYAHVDNQLSDGSTAQRGWVTRLKVNLNQGVGVLQKDIFIDHQLQPGHPFGDVLRSKVEGSALLLILLSQNYVDSKWCGKELEHFIVTHGDNPTRPRDVFVVELTPFGGFIDVPENIANLRKELIHAKFWYQTEDVPVPRVAGDPSPEESKDNGFYWLQRDVLRHALDTRLRELKRRPVKNVTHGATHWGGAAPPFSVPSSPDGTPAVLLAEVTRDLMVRRDEVKVALEKEGIRVLPEWDYEARSAQEFKTAFARDVQSSLLFVQLLAPTPGRIPEGSETPLPQLQFAAAQQAGLTIMQWCAAVPVADVIADRAHRALFRTAFLSTVNLERFKEEVIKKYRELSKTIDRPSSAGAEAQKPGKKCIFFDDLVGGEDLTRQIRTIIKQHNCEVRGLPRDSALEQNEGDMMQQLEPCRGGIMVYTDPRDRRTVLSRLNRFRKQVAEGRLTLSRWGIYFGPPPNKGDLWEEFRLEAPEEVVSIPGMDGLNETALVEFLQSL